MTPARPGRLEPGLPELPARADRHKIEDARLKIKAEPARIKVIARRRLAAGEAAAPAGWPSLRDGPRARRRDSHRRPRRPSALKRKQQRGKSGARAAHRRETKGACREKASARRR